MRICKFKTVAAFLAVPLSMIATSIVLVSVFSTPVDVVRKPGQAVVATATSTAAPVASHRVAARIPTRMLPRSRARDRRLAHDGQPGIVEPVQQVDILPAVSGRLGRLAGEHRLVGPRGDVLADLEAPS